MDFTYDEVQAKIEVILQRDGANKVYIGGVNHLGYLLPKLELKEFRLDK